MTKVLVTPLDWGLGHATRCVPIVRACLERGNEVLLAGSGDSLNLLQREFPALKSFELPAYNVRYDASRSLVFKVMMQLPRLLKVIRREHDTLKSIVEREGVEVVISDNRYGCWDDRIQSIFISHQLSLILPKPLKMFSRLVDRYHRSQIRKFNLCWIPDYVGTHSLAGRLVYHNDDRLTTKYIGNLSRFDTSRHHSVPKFDLLVLLSGPEPQRSILENLLLPQLANSGLRYFLVRGLVNGGSPLDANIPYADFLDTTELAYILDQGECVLARSGYSTIMDLAKLGKKAIFIPTPGQTEQEYLANRLMKMRVAFFMPQATFNLKTALRGSRGYMGFNFTNDRFTLLDHAIDEVLTSGPHVVETKS